jgi:hypothetical protein
MFKTRNYIKIALLVAVIAVFSFLVYSNVQAARTDETWQERSSSYLETIWREGRDILINGVNKYLNFGTFSGESGYGFRDNGGDMEFKNDGGDWTSIGGGAESDPLSLHLATGTNQTVLQTPTFNAGFYSLGNVAIGKTSSTVLLHVGNRNAASSVDSAINAARIVNSGTGNVHTYSDSSNVSRAGTIGYNSYDAIPLIDGTSNFSHYAGFQSRPIYASSGTIGEIFGFHNNPTINGTVTSNYGFYAYNATGSGSIYDNYGFYAQDLTKGSHYNFAFYAAGNSISQFGTASGRIGINIFPSHTLDIYKASYADFVLHDAGSIMRFISGGGENYLQSATSKTSGSKANFWITDYAGNNPVAGFMADGTIKFPYYTTAGFLKVDNTGLVSVGEAGSALTVKEVGGAVSVDNVTTIQFDDSTGLRVTDNGDGDVTVALGSYFKDIYVDGQDTLTPVGEEDIEYIAGSGITLETDKDSTPKSITWSVNDTLDSVTERGASTDNSITVGGIDVSDNDIDGVRDIKDSNGFTGIRLYTEEPGSVRQAITVAGAVAFDWSDGSLDLIQNTTPTNPVSGRNKLYFKSDNKLYKLNSAGSEVEVGATADLTPYAKLDGTNQPFTGSLNVSTTTPEYRLTNSSGSEYSRLTRTATSNKFEIKNRVLVQPITATSYDNAGGKGNRTASITVSFTGGLMGGTASGLVNGVFSSSDGLYFANTGVSGKYIRFDFGAGAQKVINEIKYYQQTATTQGVWQFQGSNDASSWTNIGSTFTLGSAATDTITAMSANTTTYRYYQLLGVSGSGNSSPWAYEWEFKIGEPSSAAVGEYTVLSSQDGVLAGETGKLTLGNYSGVTGSGNTYEGMSHAFNIFGTAKGTLNSTAMAWTLPNKITGASDTVQFTLLGNSTQTADILDVFASDGTTKYLGVNGAGALLVNASAVLTTEKAYIKGYTIIDNPAASLRILDTAATLQNKDFSIYRAGAGLFAVADYSTGLLGLRIDTVNGRVGIKTTPAATLHSLSTTEQLRLGYDASNYLSATIGSTGSATFALTGTSTPIFTFNQAIKGVGGFQSSDGTAGYTGTCTLLSITNFVVKNGLIVSCN